MGDKHILRVEEVNPLRLERSRQGGISVRQFEASIDCPVVVLYFKFAMAGVAGTFEAWFADLVGDVYFKQVRRHGGC